MSESDGATSGYLTKYTDTDLTIVRSDGPTILSAIPTLVARADLARRCLFVRADRDPGTHPYRDDEEVKRRISAIAPGVLHELLEAMRLALASWQNVLGALAEFSLHDFSRLAQAAAPQFSWTTGEISALLSAQIARQRMVVAENSPLVMALMDWLAARRPNQDDLSFSDADQCPWVGSLSDLLRELNAAVPTGRWSKDWPVNPAQLGAELKRLHRVLRQCGIEVEKAKRARGRWERRIQIRWLPSDSSGPESWSGGVGGRGEDWKPQRDALH